MDEDNRARLNNLLLNGVLLKSDSDNKTSVLENLYSIAVTPRAEGLDSKNILNSLIKTLDNPHNISQYLGDIPFEYGVENYSEYSNTCAAASIEFDLADKYQAEFVRFANELTSPSLMVKKVGAYDVKILDAMNVPYKVLDNGLVEVSFKPDKSALLRAQVQTRYQDEFECSAVDALLQLSFMNYKGNPQYDHLLHNVGYNSGLCVYDIALLEKIIKNKDVNPMIYQVLDKNNVVVEKEFSDEQIKDQILSSLSQNKNIIVGFCVFENELEHSDPLINPDSVAYGHEITIVGYKKHQDGRVSFLVEDSYKHSLNPIEYSEEFLLPRLNHAFVTYDAAYNSLKEKEEMLEAKIENCFSANF